MSRVVPITLAQANAYVTAVHRHNGKLPSAKFAVGLIDDDGMIVGVAVAGLPKARMLMDGGTLEVNRVATDGSRNACSTLYGACIRAAKAMGYWRLITYTLEAEPGASLRASGWRLVGAAGGGSWVEKRGGTATDQHDTGPKNRWQIDLGEPIAVTWPDVIADEHVDLFSDGAA